MYGTFEYAVHLKKQRIDVTGKKPPMLHAMVETKKHVYEADSAQKRRPVKVLVPVADDIASVPLVPPPTVVVPVTVNGKPAAVKVLPSAIERLPLIVKFAVVVVVKVP